MRRTLSEDCAEQGVDDHHEGLGARWLAGRFVADVVEPVRLHVEAKRYRCAVDADYQAQLLAYEAQSAAVASLAEKLKKIAGERDRYKSSNIILKGQLEAFRKQVSESGNVVSFLIDVYFLSGENRRRRCDTHLFPSSCRYSRPSKTAWLAANRSSRCRPFSTRKHSG